MKDFISIPVCVGVFLFCMLDVVVRLLPNTDIKLPAEIKKDVEIATYQMPPQLRSGLEEFAEAKLLETQPESELVEIDTINEDEQVGEVLEVWMGSKQYRLKAVFLKDDAFAVLEDTEATKKQDLFTNVVLEQSISGFTVSAISLDAITLVSPSGNKIYLKLFVFDNIDE